MGGPRKQKKKYITPGHPWQKDRLSEELRLMGQYGLRSKRELWRIRTQLTRYRSQARKLLALPTEELKQRELALINHLTNLGVLRTDATIDDVFSLETEDFLKRRLQSIVFSKGLATTIYHARQLITHRHVAVRERIVTCPSYLVSQEEEEHISYTASSPLIVKDHPSRPRPKASVIGQVEED
ncbi:MAG: 30S ribosomal protein S4 [Candidatus Heimdallarchaeota archaeon]